MIRMIPKKGWKRVWLKGGFRGASKDFRLRDGFVGTTVINYGCITVIGLLDGKKGVCNTMHIIFGISQKVLENLFSEDDAKEILEIYCSINRILPLR